MLTKYIIILIPITGLISLTLPTNRLESLFFHTQLIPSGEYWRFITGHFIYNNWQHWLLNTIGIGLFFLLFRNTKISKTYLYVISLLVCWISIGLLLLSQQLIWYIGFSGVLSGLYIYGACITMNNDKSLSIGVILLFIGFTGMQLYQGELVSGSIRGLHSSSYAHALGITGGFLIAGFAAVANRITTGNST